MKAVKHTHTHTHTKRYLCWSLELELPRDKGVEIVGWLGTIFYFFSLRELSSQETEPGPAQVSNKFLGTRERQRGKGQWRTQSSPCACNIVGAKDTFVEDEGTKGTQCGPEEWWFGKQTGLGLGIFTKWLRSSAIKCECLRKEDRVISEIYGSQHTMVPRMFSVHTCKLNEQSVIWVKRTGSFLGLTDQWE